MKRFLILPLLLLTGLVQAQKGDKAGAIMAPPPAEWNIPPAPALSPEDALKSFKFGEGGFRLQLVAAEPMVSDPVCLSFDANGRMWVCEMKSYMPNVDGTGEDAPVGRISIVEDTDGDGIADKSTVFLDKLVLPRAVQPVMNGILWGDQEKLYFTVNHNGKPGATTVVDEKWAEGGNVEHKSNGLMPGLDNWIYNAKSSGRYRFLNGKWVKGETEFRGQWGIAQDDYGRILTNTNSNLMNMEFVPPNYTVRNTNHIFKEKTAARMPNYVWPIRITCGVNRGYEKNTLDARGYLVSATGSGGLTIYRGDQFPHEYYGNAFIPEPCGLLMKRALITEKDGILTGAAAYTKKEFIASMDERSRFVNAYTAPDGSLYAVDMYRGILQHKEYVTTYLRNQILERGLDKHIGLGRIYRIAHQGKPLGPQPRMSEEPSESLVGHFYHPNGWWRDTAQRLLVERRDLPAESLQPALGDYENPIAQIHTLWTLEGLNAVTPEVLAVAMGSPDVKVKAAAARVAEVTAGTNAEVPVVEILKKAMATNARELDRQIAATLGLFRGEGKAAAQAALVELLSRYNKPGDQLVRDMAMSGLGGLELEFAHIALDKDLLILDDLVPAVVNSGSTTGVREMIALAESGQLAPDRRNRLLGVMARTAVAKRHGAISVLLLSEAEKAEALRPVILDGMVAGGKTKGFKPIALTTRPTLLTPATIASEPKLAAVEKLFNFNAKTPADYLKSSEHKRLYELGKVEYAKLCVACHQLNGKGLVTLAPPLVDSEWVLGPDKRLIAIVVDGVQGPITVNEVEYDVPDIQPVMPGLRANPDITDEKLAAMLTYVRNTWGNSGPAIEPKDVMSYRSSTEFRLPFTAEELSEIK